MSKTNGDYEFKVPLAVAISNCCMPQEDLALRLGVHPDTVCDWVCGKSHMRIIDLCNISKLSGIPLDYISIP